MGNQQSNGIRVGSVPVVLDLEFKATHDNKEQPPYHSRDQELCVFAEVERLFVLNISHQFRSHCYIYNIKQNEQFKKST